MNKELTMLRSLKRFAIIGGTFDPIHIGHLAAATDVLSYFNLEKIIFMPTGKPPHKSNRRISAKKHRLQMTRLATNYNPNFATSTLEMKREGMSYTVDTITEMRKICGKEAEIYFIMGTDALKDIHNWRDPGKILSQCELIVVSREAIGIDVANALKNIHELYHANPLFLKLPDIKISASEIRNRILFNRPVNCFLPHKVEHYIRNHELYIEDRIDNPYIKARVRRMVSKKRFRHIIGVAEEAVLLANAYGVDAKKAYTAGLLHDCAKEAIRHEGKCKEYGLNINAEMDKELAHGLLAEKIASRDFKIDDEDMLAAIRFHTTGRKGMSILEKIIFTSDLIEPYREAYPELDRIRELAYKDLDEAVLTGLKIKYRFTLQTGKHVDPLTIEAIKSYEKSEEFYE